MFLLKYQVAYPVVFLLFHVSILFSVGGACIKIYRGYVLQDVCVLGFIGQLDALVVFVTCSLGVAIILCLHLSELIAYIIKVATCLILSPMRTKNKQLVGHLIVIVCFQHISAVVRRTLQQIL